MNTNKRDGLMKAAKYSLAFLWLFTGLTSIYFSPEVGYEILASASITGLMADVSVYAGGALDILIGLWLISSIKIRLCCIIQVLVIVLYTVLLTFIDPSFWLHPFGPITKNIPIVVLISLIMINKEEHHD
jgi:hypothetical protein